MQSSLIVLLSALVTVAVASGYPEPKDVVSHARLNQFQCYNSKGCAYDETCERVCFWQEFTKKFQGCKVICVKKNPEVARKGYGELQPLPVAPVHHAYPSPAPAYHTVAPTYPTAAPTYPTKAPAYPTPSPSYLSPHHPSPSYPTPAPQYVHQQQAQPSSYPAPAVMKPTSLHAIVCSSREDCGVNQYCGQAKKCECIPSFVPDPSNLSRCVSLLPVYATPANHYPTTNKSHGYPTPAPKHCYTKNDCGYGESCCFWRSCDQHNQCTVQQLCMNKCH